MVELLEIVDKIAENSVTLAVVASFLVYMYIKNGKNEKAYQRLSESIDKNAEALDRNSTILGRFLVSHNGNSMDIEELSK